MYEWLDEIWRNLGLPNQIVGPFLDVLVLVALAVVLYHLVLFVMRRYIQLSFKRHGLKEVKRYETLYSILKSLVKYVSIVVVFILILNRFGVDAAALFAGAGVLGAVTLLVFQDFVKDLIAGFYFIFEKVFAIEDVVTIGTVTGTVISMGVRSTTLRGLSGELVTFTNHDISQVKNYSTASVANVIQSYVFSFGLDVEAWKTKWNESLSTFLNGRQDILEAPIILGITGLKGNAITIETLTKVKPLSQWAFQRDLNAFMYQLCKQNGFELASIPVSQIVEKI